MTNEATPTVFSLLNNAIELLNKKVTLLETENENLKDRLVPIERFLERYNEERAQINLREEDKKYGIVRNSWGDIVSASRCSGCGEYGYGCKCA